MIRTSFAFVVALTGCASAPPSLDAAPHDGAAMDATNGGSMDDAAAPSVDAADTSEYDSSRPDCVGEAHRLGTVDGMVDGHPYIVYVPNSYDEHTPTSLLLALHGAGDTPSNFLTLWRTTANVRNFIVVVPDGSVPLGSGTTWSTADVPYILHTVDEVERCYSIEPRRVVLYGLSAGGMIAFYMGLPNANRFAGIAISASSLTSIESMIGRSLLPAQWLIPVSETHGLSDPNFSYASAYAGIMRLDAAGHPTYWHSFDGGHTATPAQVQVMWDDLEMYMAP